MSASFPIKLGVGAVLDAQTLVDTRLLVTGNSGSGKSWLLRLIAEQAAPRMQTIILDPEGEYGTLREKVDAVLVGRDGEVVPTVATAAKLARKLAELAVSAIIDLYELKLPERRAFVRTFLESMMSAPKKHWRPCLFIVDEAHRFAPERGSGDAESTDAIITLMSQGRKRGYCGILATQRISKLHKDAAAEAVNGLVGRTTLDVDVRRARDILGMSKKDEGGLRELDAGTWYGFGPALSARGVTQFRAAKVTTTHPRAGQRHKLVAPAPSAKIRRVLPELAELPQKVEEEKRDLAGARKQVRDLQRELAAARRGAADPAAVEAAVARALAKAAKTYDKALTAVGRQVAKLGPLVSSIEAVERNVAVAIGGDTLPFVGDPPIATAPPKPAIRPRIPQNAANAAIDPVDGVSLGGGVGRILVALAQTPEGCDRVQLGLLAGMKPKSGTFSTYLGRLRSAGYIVNRGDRLCATDAGIDALGDDFEPLPVGDALIEYWRSRVGGGGIQRIFDALVEAGPTGLRRDELAQTAELTASAGTFSTYLGRLRSLRLASGSDPIIIAEVFH